MAGKFHLKKADDGQFHFNLNAGNGETILTSELYKAKDSALNGIESVKKNAPDMARYEKKVNKGGKPFFVLKAGNHQVIGQIESSNIDAVPLNAISQIEAEVEAKAKQCDYILFTDISGLKISAAKKLGGLLGRAAGVTGVDKAEARVDFRLFAVGESAPLMQSSATAKEEGDEASVGTALDAEAQAVVSEVKKRSR